ncbi:MAG: PHP domain-containing protein [Clostridia bacterium]|nr:PHP domain-containing protein [Clostridia bacterium]
MFHLERCYDIDELLTKNMHMHTRFSGCAKPEMTFEALVKKAEESGFDTIAITDHSNLGEGESITRCYEITKKMRDEYKTDMRILVGSELSLYGVGKFSETPEVMRSLEYRLFAQNHYHISWWEHPEDRSPRGYVDHMIACLESLFETDYADCIAHPLAAVKLKAFDDPNVLANAITENDLGGIMEKAEKAQVAWELHRGVVNGWPAFARKFYNIGREVGAHFVYASDAHSLATVGVEDIRELYKKTLI